MKLFNIPTSIALASLFWTFSNAEIKIEDLPSHVHVGSTFNVTWSNDRDYRIQDFALVRWENSIWWDSRVERVSHYPDSTKGIASTYWKVPAVKNGYYSLVMNAVEVNETGFPDFDAFIYAGTNRFIIHGGPKYYPKEIAKMVIGGFVALALIVGAFVGVARYMRKRRSLAATLGLSDNSEERYTDST